MSGLARRLSSVARRSGLISRGANRSQDQRRSHAGWRSPLDDALLRRLERLAVSPRREAAGGLGGEHRSRGRAPSTDFVDYRGYLPGDDFRQIDWNVYSRLDQLYVKQTEARERLTLHLMLDCSASMDLGDPNKFDYARQLASAVGYVSLVRYDRVQIVSSTHNGVVGRPLRGKHRFAELLASLDALNPSGKAFLQPRLADLRPGGMLGQAVVISDMLQPEGCDRELETLAAAGLRPSVIQVLSPQEIDPESGGDLELEDVETRERVEIGLSPQAVSVYRGRLEEWCRAIERYCAGRGMPYLRLSTSEPLERVVLVTMRQAGILN
jgi:uncharacterized protein (DUF58 family)